MKTAYALPQNRTEINSQLQKYPILIQQALLLIAGVLRRIAAKRQGNRLKQQSLSPDDGKQAPLCFTESVRSYAD